MVGLKMDFFLFRIWIILLMLSLHTFRNYVYNPLNSTVLINLKHSIF